MPLLGGVDAALSGGAPEPLGASPTGAGVNFAIFSAHATAIDLCLFEAGVEAEHSRLRLPGRTGDVWHGFLPGAAPGLLYGYRVDGPYAPEAGHRFNPNKLVLDPYARGIIGRVEWDDSTCGYDPASTERDLSFDTRDSAAFMPRAAVVDERFDWDDDRPPAHPWSRTFIYEAHVRGLTRLHPDIPPELRGTYEALGQPSIVRHLRELGVTALELLPTHAFCDDRFLVRRGLTNYWGYSTLGFFAPEPRYFGPAGPAGLKAAIKALHAAGIEVILDVVFNHTAELEETGPTLSFRGIDNATYYKPLPGDLGRTYNCTGCGNSLDLSHPAVARLVLDSLRHWIGQYHVDGFRFDLAATLARNPYAFDAGCGFLTALAADPILSRAKLIAEPWDIGEGGYRLGGFPPGWRDWNDVFRDSVRRFWRGDPGSLPGLARAVAGSREVFEKGGHGPLASINYVCSHDGFTLDDLVSYEARHNLANGEENRDGAHDNLAWNCGHEGATDDPAILELRRRQKRNMLATVMLAQGVPMLGMGDELSRSQGGNNNPYCQDNPTGWLDWTGGRAADPGLPVLVATLAALRRDLPALRRETFFSGEADPATGRKDVVWLTPDGRELGGPDWVDQDRRTFGMRFGDEAEGGTPLLGLFNAAAEDVPFRLPPCPDAGAWRVLLDTSAPIVVAAGDASGFGPGGTFTLKARSLVLFRGSQTTG